MVIDVKYLAGILFIIIGLAVSYWVFNNGGDVNNISVVLGYWTGFFAHIILSWGEKK